jgi:16S rRNA C967 or C1407 C5-methylase (RsmB/RsmF family)/NOL1/NOP2/fmu family ribosome biogenesis protein
MKNDLPTAFRTRMQAQLGANFADFAAALAETPPVSVRLNPTKPTAQFIDNEPIAWCAAGRYLPVRPVFALDPLWHSGAYYVQEAASMWITTALQQQIDFTQPLRVLDLCAAPGGKTTLLASLLHPDSLLVGNEAIQSRVGVLKENMVRWGFSNIVISNHDPSEFAALNSFFDIILVDAPCSGEGLFRKDANSMHEWSSENVRLCAARQQRILGAAVPLLKPDGLLLYSTCTYNTTENEENVAWLCNSFSLKPCTLKTTDDLRILPTLCKIGYQCMPHEIKGEGFYFALLRNTIATDIALQHSDDDNDFKENKNKTASKKPFKKAETQFKNARLLTATETTTFAPYLHNIAAYVFYQKPNNEVFALRKTLLDSYLAIDAALQKKQLGTRIGELLGRGVFVPSHDLALSPALLSPTIPTIALAKMDALTYLRKANFALPESATTLRGWAVATFEGCALGWLKVLPNRFNNYLPNEWRLRLQD